MSGRRSLAGLSVFVVFLGAWLAVLVSALFPGVLNWDAFEQLHQGVSGEYRTTFTIAYAWLLGRSHDIFGGVGALWLAQLFLFCAALLWLVDRGRARVAVVVTAVVGLLFPPLWAGLAQHWRDTWVGVLCLVAFCGALGRAPVLVIVASVAAAQFRSNAVLIALPLGAVAARDLLVPALRRSSPLRPWRRRIVVGLGAVAVAVCCVVTSSLVTKGLQALPGFPIGPSLVFDIADMWRREPSLRKKTALPSRVVKKAARKVTACDAHNVVDGDIPELEVKQLYGLREALWKDWRAAVVARPGTFVLHKLRATACMLRIDYDPPRYRFGYALHSRGSHGAGDFKVKKTPATAKMQERFWNEWKPLFQPLLWLALFAVASVVALRRRPRAPVIAFVVGNVLFLLSNFALAPAPNLRYLFPLLPAVLGLFVVGAAGRRFVVTARRRATPRASPSETPAPTAPTPPPAAATTATTATTTTTTEPMPTETP